MRLLRCWLQASWKTTLLAALLLINAAVMSLKGSRSFRLWLPLLPMLVPISAWGWGALRGVGLERTRTWRAVAGAAVLVGGLWLGLGLVGGGLGSLVVAKLSMNEQ